MNRGRTPGVVRAVVDLAVGLGWIGVALAFSAFSIAAVIGIAFLIREVFPFLPKAAVGLAFLVSFLLYAAIAGWIGWKLLQKKLR